MYCVCCQAQDQITIPGLRFRRKGNRVARKEEKEEKSFDAFLSRAQKHVSRSFASFLSFPPSSSSSSSHRINLMRQSVTRGCNVRQGGNGVNSVQSRMRDKVSLFTRKSLSSLTSCSCLVAQKPQRVCDRHARRRMGSNHSAVIHSMPSLRQEKKRRKSSGIPDTLWMRVCVHRLPDPTPFPIL